MSSGDWIGFIGVTILLLAFLLNLTGKIKQNDLSYIVMNIIGAGLAGFASYLISYVPFIILEGVWTLVSIYGLINYFIRKRPN
jgi:hypothetical protein